MNTKLYPRAALTLIFLAAVFSCTNNKRESAQANNDLVADTLSTVTGELFRYRFKKEPSYAYLILLDKKTENDSSLYAVLYKGQEEVDWQSLGMEHYLPVKHGSFKRAIPDTGIDPVDELAMLSYYEDNDDENASGESSESVEEKTVTMLFGRSGDKLIREVFTKSTYYFSYEGDLEYEFRTTEEFILPDDAGGVKDHILFETHKTYLAVTDRKDSCLDEYTAKRKLQFREGEFTESNGETTRRSIEHSDAVSVREFPAVCTDFIIGELQPGAEVEVLERSETETEILTSEGESAIARWIKIRFKSDYGDAGYILDHVLKN